MLFQEYEKKLKNFLCVFFFLMEVPLFQETSPAQEKFWRI